MTRTWKPWSVLTLTVVLLAFAGWRRAAQTTSVDLDSGPYGISGPYNHENLTVFLIHSSNQDERDFVTLDQGLKDGLVKVTEKEQAEVGNLQIENLSDSPLFLQEGDRLQGGKQDRTILASLVVPAKSGSMPLPTFCIEQSRWHAGAQGQAFAYCANSALAPKDVRFACKINMNQSGVWAKVQDQKVSTEQLQLASNSNSSLNETLDSPKVQRISDAVARALGGVLSDHCDAVGVAIAVNGNIEEVNIYPNHMLLSKQYKRLLESYALQAALEKDIAKEAKPVSAEDVLQFIGSKDEKRQQVQKINQHNEMLVRDLESDVVECQTTYDGQVVHHQRLRETNSKSCDRGNGPVDASLPPRE